MATFLADLESANVSGATALEFWNYFPLAMQLLVAPALLQVMVNVSPAFLQAMVNISLDNQ